MNQNGKVTLAVLKNDIEHMRKELQEIKQEINTILRNHEERLREVEICAENLKPLKGLVYSLITAVATTSVLYSIFLLRK